MYTAYVYLYVNFNCRLPSFRDLYTVLLFIQTFLKPKRENTWNMRQGKASTASLRQWQVACLHSNSSKFGCSSQLMQGRVLLLAAPLAKRWQNVVCFLRLCVVGSDHQFLCRWLCLQGPAANGKHDTESSKGQTKVGRSSKQVAGKMHWCVMVLFINDVVLSYVPYRWCISWLRTAMQSTVMHGVANCSEQCHFKY